MASNLVYYPFDDEKRKRITALIKQTLNNWEKRIKDIEVNIEVDSGSSNYSVSVLNINIGYTIWANNEKRIMKFTRET